MEALRVEWQNSTPRFTWTPELTNGNINLNKYLISSCGDGTHNQSVLQSHFVPLRHDWPHTILIFICFYKTQIAICSEQQTIVLKPDLPNFGITHHINIIFQIQGLIKYLGRHPPSSTRLSHVAYHCDCLTTIFTLVCFISCDIMSCDISYGLKFY